MTNVLGPKTLAGRRLLDRLIPAPPDGATSVVDDVRWGARDELAASICRIEDEATEPLRIMRAPTKREVEAGSLVGRIEYLEKQMYQICRCEWYPHFGPRQETSPDCLLHGRHPHGRSL